MSAAHRYDRVRAAEHIECHVCSCGLCDDVRRAAIVDAAIWADVDAYEREQRSTVPARKAG